MRRYPPDLNPRRFAEIHLAHEQLTSPDRGMDEALHRPKVALESLFPLPEIRLSLPPQPPTRSSLEGLSPLLQPLRRVLLRELLEDAGWASETTEQR